MTQMVELEDVLATIERVGNFGDYTRDELTADHGQPRFDMMHDIMRAVFAMPTVEPDIVAPPECNCDDPDCPARHEPLTLRQAYDNCLERLRQAEDALREIHSRRLTMWADVAKDDYPPHEIVWHCNEEGSKDGYHDESVVELAAVTFPVGTVLQIWEPKEEAMDRTSRVSSQP